MTGLAVLGSGMVTAVGLTSAAACSAMRAALSGFVETKFVSRTGEWLLGCPVPLAEPWRGLARLTRLVAPAIHECLTVAGTGRPEAIPVFLCVAEPDRPGRLAGLDDRLLGDVQALLGVQFHPRSEVIPRGRVGGAVAIDRARRLMAAERLSRCIVAGVDSLLLAPTITAFEGRYRLLTEENSNGFIPGEAGAAVLLGPAFETGRFDLRCRAIGFGREAATIAADLPLRADGLVQAFRALQTDGGVSLDDAEYRYTDCNGEQYGFKQDRLAIARVVRKLKERFDHLHPADSVGEIGAAVGPCVFGLAHAGARKGYAPGRGVLCHFSNDDGQRAALLLRYDEKDGAR